VKARAWLLATAVSVTSLGAIASPSGATGAVSAAVEVTSGPAWPQRGEVALTFDDGPSAYTQAVLDVLADKGVRATFFVIGDYVNASTAPLLAAVSAAGHSVQNHSRTHPHLASLSPGQITEQLSSTSDRVEQATGVRPSCFRPPYGSTSAQVRSVAAAGGLSEVLWTTDTNDFTRPGAGVIAARALADADGRPLTILMHDGGGSRSQTVDALGSVIDGLRARGYDFVTLCSRRAVGVPQRGAERNVTQTPSMSRASVAPAGLVAMDPVRVFDSRSGAAIEAGTTASVDVSAVVPPDSAAAMLQVTVDRAVGAGFVSVVDCANPRPTTSVVNFVAGVATASAALARIVGGRVCLVASAGAHLIVDVTGSFAPSSTVGLRSTPPTRLIDTRAESGSLAAGTTTVVVPPTAAAAFVNVTAVDPAAAGYLTAWPCDSPRPPTSTVNFSPAQAAVANGAVIRTGAGGLCVWNSAPVDVIVDLLGVFEDGGALLRMVEPCRLLDLRDGVGGWHGRIVGGQSIDVATGVGPGDVLIGTVTATQVIGSGFVSLTPDGGVPLTSNLNASGAADVANFTAVAVGADGRIRVSVGGTVTTDVLLDIVGTFARQPPT